MRSSFSLLVVLLLLIGGQSAAAQVVVAEDPRTGERLVMSEDLRRAEHKIMIRAIGRVGNERTEWALTFRSTDASSDVRITADGEPVEPLRVATDEGAPGGMTTVFFSGEAFYAVAHAQNVEVVIGERSLTLPDRIRADMQEIMNRARR